MKQPDANTAGDRIKGEPNTSLTKDRIRNEPEEDSRSRAKPGNLGVGGERARVGRQEIFRNKESYRISGKFVQRIKRYRLVS
jgi:hypothetical protein